MSPTILKGLALLLVSSTVLSLILTPIVRWLALKLDFVDHPGERKIHGNAMPYGGGVAVVMTVAGIIMAAMLIIKDGRVLEYFPQIKQAIKPHMEGIFDFNTWNRLGAILWGGLIMFLTGLVDDKRGMNPLLKLILQIVAASLLVYSGIIITIFIDSFWINASITVFWVVAISNAFNFIDNMDGLCAGVALISASMFGVIAINGGEIFIAAFFAVFAGALLGFLKYNFSPAKIFLGDAGSLFIGFTLASLAVAGTYYEGRGSVYSVCMPVLVLGVVIFDLLGVMLIRIKNHKPVYLGDTNHLSHRLVRLGLSRREAVLTIYLLALVLGGLAILLRSQPEGGAAIVFFIAIGIIVLMVLLEVAATRSRPADNIEGDKDV